ncbi:MAG: sodium ion-translocating decarboxylase subunit beta [Clostridia bacterium]|nr:sodium ion-translocating decarboxylase subunit beta [Clostridia bacterium]
MKHFFKDWSFTKHLTVSAILSLAVYMITAIFQLNHSPASIGIIGGADGPTTVFAGNRGGPGLLNVLWDSIYNTLSLLIFLVLLVLYIPIQRLILRRNEKR